MQYWYPCVLRGQRRETPRSPQDHGTGSYPGPVDTAPQVLTLCILPAQAQTFFSLLSGPLHLPAPPSILLEVRLVLLSHISLCELPVPVLCVCFTTRLPTSLFKDWEYHILGVTCVTKYFEILYGISCQEGCC